MTKVSITRQHKQSKTTQLTFTTELLMNPTLMTALAYTLAIPVALAQRLLPALQLSFDYLLFLMTDAGALPEMTTAPMPVASLALADAVTAVATPVKAPPSKTTRKTSTKPSSTTTSVT